MSWKKARPLLYKYWSLSNVDGNARLAEMYYKNWNYHQQQNMINRLKREIAAMEEKNVFWDKIDTVVLS